MRDKISIARTPLQRAWKCLKLDNKCRGFTDKGDSRKVSLTVDKFVYYMLAKVAQSEVVTQ